MKWLQAVFVMVGCLVSLEMIQFLLTPFGRKDFMGFGMSQSVLPLKTFGLLLEGPSHYHST
jgi:hypothetical protein